MAGEPRCSAEHDDAAIRALVAANTIAQHSAASLTPRLLSDIEAIAITHSC